MGERNLTLVELTCTGDDAIAVLRTMRERDRYFPPAIASTILDERPLLARQRCFSRPDPRDRALAAIPTRRRTFADEIHANQGRGTESGHFVEHLVLAVVSDIARGGTGRRLRARTRWDFAVAPDLFRIQFRSIDARLIRDAIVHASDVLALHGYGLDVGAASR